MTQKILSDEVAEDVKDDLLVAPNFPSAPRLKPRLPTRGPAKRLSPDLVTYEKAADHAGAMVALRIPPFAARQVALPGGEPAEDLHVTLVYLGDAASLEPGAVSRLRDGLAAVAARTPPLSGRISGYGRFRKPAEGDTGEAEDVIWVGLDSADLPELRHAVLRACRDAAVEPQGDHGFTPHVTLAYVEPGEGEDSMPPDVQVTIKYISLVVSGEEAAYRLSGQDSAGDEKPQRTMPDETFSVVMQPKVGAFATIERLEEWAQGRGDLMVRADVGGPDCVVVKKGSDVRVAVRGWDAEEVQFGDLVGAMGRIDHDYIVYGWLQAKDLRGRWVSDPGELEEVLSAEKIATPVFLPCNLIAMDGDLTGRTARERWELMRALVPEAGGHVVVPMQIICRADQELEAAVDEAMRWRPSSGEGMEPVGVSCVPAESKYEHGETDQMARLTLRKVEKYSPDQDRDEAGRWMSGVGPDSPSWGNGFVKPDGVFVPGRGREHDDLARDHGFRNREYARRAGWVRTSRYLSTLNIDFQDDIPAARENAARLAREHFEHKAEAEQLFPTVVAVDRWPNGAVQTGQPSDYGRFGTARGAVRFINTGDKRESVAAEKYSEDQERDEDGKWSAEGIAGGRVRVVPYQAGPEAVHSGARQWSISSGKTSAKVISYGGDDEELEVHDITSYATSHRDTLAVLHGVRDLAVRVGAETIRAHVMNGKLGKFLHDRLGAERYAEPGWDVRGHGELPEYMGSYRIDVSRLPVAKAEVEYLEKSTLLDRMTAQLGFGGEPGDGVEKYSPEQERDESGRWTAEGQPSVGYHVTPARHDDGIRERGIKTDRTYVWDNLESARWFADFQDEPMTIWRVDLAGRDMHRDPEARRGEDWSTALPRGEMGGWIVSGPIKTEHVRPITKQFGFGAGPGPGEPPDWMDHISDQRRKPNFLRPEKDRGDNLRDEAGRWTSTGGAGTAPGKIWATDRASAELSDMMREWHNTSSRESFEELVGYTTNTDEAFESARQATLEDLPYGADGTVMLYRGGADDESGRAASWTTDKKWAERFARGFVGGPPGGGGLGAKVIQRDFKREDLLVVLPWEGEVIVRGRQVGKDVFGTSGTSGILAPQQGVFRRPRKYEADNVSVGVPLVLLPRVQTGGRRPRVGDAFPSYPRPDVSKDMGNVSGGGSGDGDSFSVSGAAVSVGHTFVVGRLKNGEFVPDPDHPRVNPYEAIFRRGVRVVPTAKYSPDQARDEAGRWTDVGGSVGAGKERALAHLSKMPSGDWSEPDEESGGDRKWLLPDGRLIEDTSREAMAHEDTATGLGFRSLEDMMVSSGIARVVVEMDAGDSDLPGRINVHFNVNPTDAQAREFVHAARRNRVPLQVTSGSREEEFQRPTVDAVKAWLADAKKAVQAPVGGESPDARKPRKYPDVGADMGFNDSFDAKSEGPIYLTAEDADAPVYLTEKDYDEGEHPRDEVGRWTSGGGVVDIPGTERVPAGRIPTDRDASAWVTPGGVAIVFPSPRATPGGLEHWEVAQQMGYAPASGTPPQRWPTGTSRPEGESVEAALADGNVRVRVAASTLRYPGGAVYVEFHPGRGRDAAIDLLASMGSDKPVWVEQSGNPGNVRESGRWNSAAAAARDLRRGVWREEPMMAMKYSDDQLRDESGRWTDGGGGNIGGKSPAAREALRQARREGIMHGVDEPDRAEPTQEEAYGVDGKVRLRRCYDTAGRYMLDLDIRQRMVGQGPPIKDSEVTLVHGTVTIGGATIDVGGTGPYDDPPGRVTVGGLPIGHGWVEIKRPDGTELVYDGVQGKFYDKRSYYRNMRAVDEHRYTRAQGLKMMMSTKNFGPWERTAGMTAGKVRFADGSPAREGG